LRRGIYYENTQSKKRGVVIKGRRGFERKRDILKYRGEKEDSIVRKFEVKRSSSCLIIRSDHEVENTNSGETPLKVMGRPRIQFGEL